MDIEERTIEVLEKGNKLNKVKYPSRLDRLFNRYLEVERPSYLSSDESEYLFVSKMGSHLTYGAIYKIVKKAAERAGIQEVVYEKPNGEKVWKVKPHVLRHSFATHADDDEIRLKNISEMMNHDNLSTTEKYIESSEEKVFESFENKFKGV